MLFGQTLLRTLRAQTGNPTFMLDDVPELRQNYLNYLSQVAVSAPKAGAETPYVPPSGLLQLAGFRGDKDASGADL